MGAESLTWSFLSVSTSSTVALVDYKACYFHHSQRAQQHSIREAVDLFFHDPVSRNSLRKAVGIQLLTTNSPLIALFVDEYETARYEHEDKLEVFIAHH